MHPHLVQEKISTKEIESIDESSLLLMFTMMEMLREDTRFNVSAGDILAEESFSGKGGEFGGGGASGNWEEEKCDTKCESCDLHEEPEPEPGSGDSNDNNSSSDNE